MKEPSITYEDAGVSIARGDKLVDYLRAKNSAIGGFSGLLPLPKQKGKSPLLVASTDGVGTKLLVARQANELSTIGIDLVAMVVNDIVVCGAKPLFFLDYFATGKLKLGEGRRILEGILRGCEIARMPLLGGETAEMPGLYAPGDFDLAGFGVGIVDKADLIDGRSVRAGDLVYGFESSGIHSNGYSLVRHVLIERAGLKLGTRIRELGTTLKKALLEPTRIYVALMDEIWRRKVRLGACAHITGGGIAGNLCRVLPPKLDAVVSLDRWETPPIFKLIMESGPVDFAEMLRTFNMGLGFMAVAPASERERIGRAAQASGDRVHVVGEIVKGSGKVRVVA